MGMGSGKGKTPKSTVVKGKATKDSSSSMGKALSYLRDTKAPAKPAKIAGSLLAEKKAADVKAAKAGAAEQKARADKDARRAKAEAMAAAKAKKPAPYKPGEGGRGLPPKATSFKDTPKQSGDTPKRGEDGYVLHNPGPAKKPLGSAASGMGTAPAMKKGGMCKKYARGGGIEVRGKTKGKFI